MTWWQFALWGAFGGFAVEAIQFYGALRRTGDWPWKTPGEPARGPLAASIVIRVGLGLGLAAAAGQTGQIAGAIGAIAVGVAAPLLIEQMARQISLSEELPSETPAAPARTDSQTLESDVTIVGGARHAQPESDGDASA